jgi:DNA-binding protein HU-beta
MLDFLKFLLLFGFIYGKISMYDFYCMQFALNDLVVKNFIGGSKMNKTELVASVAAKANISKKDAEKAVAAFIDSVAEELKNGGKVQLIGFGTFAVRENAARNGINPLTKAPIQIAASKTPVFKAGAALKAAIK